MKYRILSNGQEINIIEADFLFVSAYCSTNNYTFEEIIENVPIINLQTERIQQSKTDLEDYLEKHPLQWTDGEYYSITQEKQNQLTSKIMAATMAQTLSQEYDLTWNSTGEVCKPWTLQDLSTLAFAIDKRVTGLVTYQQQKEIEIKNATTQEELNNIVVNYDEVEFSLT